MLRYLIGLTLVASMLGVSSARQNEDPITYDVEPGENGKLVFPKLKVGDSVRFGGSTAFAGGKLEVKAEGAGKLTKSSRVERVIGGKVLLTGRKNMEFEVKAEKAGTIKIKVTNTEGGKTQSEDYEVIVE